jgi:hypothetical protein
MKTNAFPMPSCWRDVVADVCRIDCDHTCQCAREKEWLTIFSGQHRGLFYVSRLLAWTLNRLRLERERPRREPCCC